MKKAKLGRLSGWTRSGSSEIAVRSCQFRAHAVTLHIPMWRLCDPTAMAAPSLYPSLQTLQRKNRPIALLGRIQRFRAESKFASVAGISVSLMKPGAAF